MKFYFTENYINGISQKSKQSEIWRQFLPDLYVAKTNAIGKVRDINFQAPGKKRANWLWCFSWSRFSCHVSHLFSIGQKEMDKVIYFLNQRYVAVKKIPNNKFFIHQIRCTHYLNEKIETHLMATLEVPTSGTKIQIKNGKIDMIYRYTLFSF